MNKKALFAIMMLTLTVTINCNAFAAPNTAQSTELEQTQDAKKDIQAKVQKLDKEIDAVLEKIDSNKKDMNIIAQNIKDTEIKLEAAENDLKAHEELSKTRLRAIYKSDLKNKYIEIILSSNNLSDLTSRLNMITEVMQMDKNIIDKAKEQQQAILKQKEDLNYENSKLESLKASNESTLTKLSDDIKEQKKLLDKITAKENELIAAEKAKELPSNNNNNNNNNNSSNGAIISRGTSNSMSYSRVLHMQATAYCDDGITASGARTKRDPDGYSTIAVDPRVIPLGSKVYVEGYGYAIAEDTGGAIKGSIIDLFVTSNSEALSWGRRSVTVYILNN